MAADSSFRSLVRRLRRDTASGAAELAKTAAEGLARAVAELETATVEELGRAVLDQVGPLLEAQPAMAPLYSLSRRVLSAIEGAPSVAAARTAAAEAATRFAEGHGGRVEAAARHAAGALSDVTRVATVSRSSTVLRVLELWGIGSGRGGVPGSRTSADDAAERPRRSVLCLESRPGNEGRDTARSLAGAGLEVDYAVDAAAYRLVPACHALVLGADSVGDGGVVNKIGSAAAAWAASGTGVPVLVVADSTKILPVGVAQVIKDDRPAEEVWDAPTAGVRPWNQYFEIVPLSLITSVITEGGVYAPDELARYRAGIEVPSLLGG
jgi:translation initiation factor 2B subunit (eIF-2B alpha/beta/delta family)